MFDGDGMGPRVIDLFCGAGGLSQGFRQAGFDIKLGADADALAIQTYAANQVGAEAVLCDLREMSGSDLLSRAGIDDVDVVIGGPSCQGFSTHGRRNGWVRSDDPRNFLYKEYARLLQELEPTCFVMENVPGLLYFDSGRFWQRIQRSFRQAGYVVEAQLMLAADYGVPQLRRRLIIVGTRLDSPFEFPGKSHVGALRRDHRELWERRRLAQTPALPKHVGVWDAISDLPVLTAGDGKEISRYGGPALSTYQARMRRGSRWLYDHQATPISDAHLALIRQVPEGGSWRDIPVRDLPARFARIRRTDGTTLFGRLEREFPAYTMTTQFDNITTGCYTHPLQDRSLSVREGARIQSFPDRYRFYGTPTNKYRQIGNAVPPLLAQVVAEALLGHLHGVGNTSSAELIGAY